MPHLVRARTLLFALLVVAIAIAPGCARRSKEAPLLPRTQTLAELRVVRLGVTVTPPGEASRAPYPRERLVDGEAVTLAPGALAWLRRDAGATLLVRGPARLVVHPGTLELGQGRAFIDTPGAATTTLVTPGGPLELAHVRASVDVAESGETDAYVLAGEVRAPRDAKGAERARAGEAVRIPAGSGAATVTAAVAWDDWTGGLGTTERGAEPAPYGVGTVGARAPGEQGTPRFPLSIQSLDVRVTVDHDLAVTEVDETFFNPSSDVVEGLYRFRAPDGATLHRFGVDREGVMVWGHVKEKQQAAAQYQANVYQGSKEDPALLEWEAPSVYRARLYPIGPGESRRVVVRYAEWLGRTGARGERRLYVYPMAAEGAEASLPTIEELSVRFDLAKAGADEVRVGMAGVREGTTVVVREHDLVPRADLALELFDAGASAPAVYRAPHRLALATLSPTERAEAARHDKTEADYVLVRLRPTDVPAPGGGLDLAVVVDTSAGTPQGSIGVARAALGALLAHLGADDRVAVWAGDTGLRPLVAGETGLAPVDERRRGRILSELGAAPRGGASDLGAMLTEAAGALDPARRGAVVYVGDGVPTVGEATLTDLRARLGHLARPVRVFTLGVGDEANMALLKGLSRGALSERIGDANGAARAALRLLEQAERPALLGATIDLGPSVERIFPRELGAIVADENLVVVGRAPGRASPTSVTVAGPNGAPVTAAVTLTPVDDLGDLSQRWAEARLAELLDEGAGRAAMVDVGVHHGIITPFTSFYVPTKREMTQEEREDFERRKAQRAADQPDGGVFTPHAESRLVVPAKELAPTPVVDAEKLDSTTTIPPGLPAVGAKDAAEFGMIGLLNAGAGGDPNAPTAPWGRDDSAGQPSPALQYAPPSASAAPPSEAPPAVGTGSGQGFGSGHGRLGGAHRSAAPQVRMGAVQVTGRLPPEVVQRIVRQNFGRFRLCYENGLRNNPNLQGRVSVRFVVDVRGNVVNTGNGGSDMPDSAVVSCVVRAFYGLNFPAPESGVVTVVYPIMFSPGGGATTPAPPERARPAAPAAPTPKVATGDVPRVGRRCDDAAFVPFEDRVSLWRERLARYGSNPDAVALTYEKALVACEAPTWRERVRLLALMLDAVPNVAGRVALWKALREHPWAADVTYRGMYARARAPSEQRELHAALGLKVMGATELAKLLHDAKTPALRVKALRRQALVWPHDFDLAVKLLDALEDAGDDAAARALARELRGRADADGVLRTAVGELYLRLAARATSPADRARDEAEARRAFGEIVEFAPEDPVARRRLGDLLRAHGWYADAVRQYETLARLAPEDPNVFLLLAAAHQGLGELEAAVKWTEHAGASGAPGDAVGAAATARGFAATYLAWGRLEADEAQRPEELGRISARLARVLATERAPGAAGAHMKTARFSLTWDHPEFHPTLWSHALGSARLAPEGDAAMGIALAVVPARDGLAVEVRVDPDELEHAARLGATATLTALFEDAATPHAVKIRVAFAAGDPPRRRFAIADSGSDLRELAR